MLEFQIDDMTCQHCVGVLTKAFARHAPDAEVQVDLPGHRLQVQGGQLSPAQARRIIEDAGYTPVER